MPYLCKIRTDIPDAILQVLDLQPNESQRNLIYEPRGQNKYLDRVTNDTVAVVANVTVARFEGVAAWLIDTIEDTGDGGALTPAEANTIALALIANMDAGAASTVAAVNAIIQATVAASGIGLGVSVGTLAELLKILAGGEYVVPAGTAANPAAAQYKGVAAGAFTSGQFLQTRQSGALEISLGDGHLAQLTAATYSYAGVTGAAVVVYDDDGTIKVAVP
jgi:hypothetical protein